LGDGLAVSKRLIGSGRRTSPQEIRHHQFRAAELSLGSNLRFMVLTYFTPSWNVKRQHLAAHGKFVLISKGGGA
jgi:hypothetical protein